MAIPCYVSGKGMFATASTWSFKTAVIDALESTGLGYDTRYRYYRRQFPDMEARQLARMICDPMERYDRDWPAYRERHRDTGDDIHLATAFMLELDDRFRAEAQVALACYDEAGFGSGVNAMVFLQAGKPILGFYHPDHLGPSLNLSNILQLELAYPELVTLVEYHSLEDITSTVIRYLEQLPAGHLP